MKVLRCIVLTLILHSGGVIDDKLPAQTESFTQANEHFREGNYKESIALYESILEKDFHSTDVYFNLGNAYYKIGETGKAILHFEKALKLNPNNRKASQNLKIVKRDVQPEISVIPDFFLVRYWNAVCNLFSSRVWAVINLISFAMVAAGLWVYLIPQKVSVKKIGFYSTLVCLFISIVLLLISVRKLSLETDARYAIIMNDEAVLMSGPDERSHQKIKLGEGVKIRLIDHINQWYKVELMDKEQGWIRNNEMELI